MPPQDRRPGDDLGRAADKLRSDWERLAESAPEMDQQFYEATRAADKLRSDWERLAENASKMGPREVFEETRRLETRDREIRESSQLALAGLAAAEVRTRSRESHTLSRGHRRSTRSRESHTLSRGHRRATRRSESPPGDDPAPSDEPPAAGLELQRHPKYGPVSPTLLRLIEEAGS